MRVDIEVTFQLHLYFHRCLWVDTKLTLFVNALDTIADISRVASWLEDLNVFSKASLEHALSIDIKFRNMPAVTEDTVTIFLVPPILTPATILRLWSSSLAWPTLVPIVSTPGTLSTSVVPETRKPLLGQCVLVITHTGTTLCLTLCSTIIVHRPTTLHSTCAFITAGTLLLLGLIPPTGTSFLALCVIFEVFDLLLTGKLGTVAFRLPL